MAEAKAKREKEKEKERESGSDSLGYDTSDEERERVRVADVKVREVDVSVNVAGVKERAAEHPPPTVYLCLDIEATCDGTYVASSTNPDATVRLFQQGFENEILELPVEAVDAKTGHRLSVDQPSWAFHTYVAPKRKPSRFCTDLTDIDAEKLRKAPTLGVALQRLEGWLRRRNLVPWPLANTKDGEINYIWVTDGSWDFGKFLWHDCRRKGIVYPFACNAWCDVREAFRSTWPKTPLRPPMLQNMVSQVGLSWTGPPHRGDVDTRNLAALVGVIARCNPTTLLPTRCLPYELLKDCSYYRPGYFSNPGLAPQHRTAQAMMRRLPPSIPTGLAAQHAYQGRGERYRETQWAEQGQHLPHHHHHPHPHHLTPHPHAYRRGAYAMHQGVYRGRGGGACYYDVCAVGAYYPGPHEGSHSSSGASSASSSFSGSAGTPPPPPLAHARAAGGAHQQQVRSAHLGGASAPPHGRDAAGGSPVSRARSSSGSLEEEAVSAVWGADPDAGYQAWCDMEGYAYASGGWGDSSEAWYRDYPMGGVGAMYYPRHMSYLDGGVAYACDMCNGTGYLGYEGECPKCCGYDDESACEVGAVPVDHTHYGYAPPTVYLDAVGHKAAAAGGGAGGGGAAQHVPHSQAGGGGGGAGGGGSVGRQRGASGSGGQQHMQQRCYAEVAGGSGGAHRGGAAGACRVSAPYTPPFARGGKGRAGKGKGAVV